MLIVRKADAKFRNKFSSLLRRILNIAKAGKQPAARLPWTDSNMAVRANCGRRPLTRKKLRAMAIQTGGMLGKISDISERFVAFAYILPILAGKFMA